MPTSFTIGHSSSLDHSYQPSRIPILKQSYAIAKQDSHIVEAWDRSLKTFIIESLTTHDANWLAIDVLRRGHVLKNLPSSPTIIITVPSIENYQSQEATLTSTPELDPIWKKIATDGYLKCRSQGVEMNVEIIQGNIHRNVNDSASLQPSIAASIGIQAKSWTGTLGGFLTVKGPQAPLLALTCHHVLSLDCGDPVEFGETSTTNLRLEKSTLRAKNQDRVIGRSFASSGYRIGSTGGSLDWGLIEITSESNVDWIARNRIPDTNGKYDVNQQFVSQKTKINLNNKVFKFGKSTGFTKGTHNEIRSEVNLPGNSGKSTEHCIVSSKNSPFSVPGDSGAWILDLEDLLGGMVIGGNDASDCTYFTPIDDIIQDVLQQTGFEMTIKDVPFTDSSLRPNSLY